MPALIPVPPVKGPLVALWVKSKLGYGTFHPGDSFRPPWALLNEGDSGTPPSMEQSLFVAIGKRNPAVAEIGELSNCDPLLAGRNNHGISRMGG